MKILRTVVILALFLPIGVLSGCVGGPVNSNANVAALNPTLENANSARTNVEELQLLINIPFKIEDEDIVWKEDAAEKKLTAVLLFSTADAEKIVAEASARQPAQSVTVPSESWFPSELIALGELSGDDSLKGFSYSAVGFYHEPYSSGQIIRIEGTDYFVLDLSAK